MNDKTLMDCLRMVVKAKVALKEMIEYTTTVEYEEKVGSEVAANNACKALALYGLYNRCQNKILQKLVK